jgi:hypothetical protein
VGRWIALMEALIEAMSGKEDVTLMALFIGVFHPFLTDKLVHLIRDKGGNCERIYT